MFPKLISLQFKTWVSAPSGNDLTVIPQPFSHIQSLQLELSNLPLLYGQQFTSHLPDCLATLNIKVIDTRFDDWVEEIGQHHAYQFSARASRINEFELVFNTRIVGVEARLQISAEAKTNITIFYSFLNSIIGNRRMLYSGANFNIMSKEQKFRCMMMAQKLHLTIL